MHHLLVWVLQQLLQFTDDLGKLLNFCLALQLKSLSFLDQNIQTCRKMLLPKCKAKQDETQPEDSRKDSSASATRFLLFVMQKLTAQGSLTEVVSESVCH